MTTQANFSKALLDPSVPTPMGLVDPQGRPVGKRFQVYRNNVVVGLIDALRDSFPVIVKLLGDDNFNAIAGVFVRAHPPKSPLMMFYGDAFADFLTGFEPLAHLGYLPDVARLEQALRRAYHAADRPVFDPALLQHLTPDQLMTAQIFLAPAVHLIRSDWPIHAIWQFNMAEGTPAPVMQAEDVLITRGADLDPALHLIPRSNAAFLAAILAGSRLEQAMDQARDADLAQILTLLLQSGAIATIRQGVPE